MNFELGNSTQQSSKLSPVSKIFLAIAIAVVAALLQFSAFSTSAEAATVTGTPVSVTKLKITTCDQAITGMNKTLTLIAKRRIELRTAKKSRNAKKVKRAKKLFKSAQKQGNDVRTAIKRLCLGGGVNAQNAACSASITKLESLINLRYTRTLRYKKLKKPKSKSKKVQARYKKRKRAMKTQLKNLGNQIAAQTDTFAKACGGGSGTGTGVTGSGNGPSTPATDTTAPGAVTITGPTGSTNDTTPTFLVTPPAGESGGKVECKTDNGNYVTVLGSGAVEYTTSELSDGTHTITCRYVDAAGNPGSETTVVVTIDTEAPGAPTIVGPTTTNSSTPEFTLSGAGEGETYECKLGEDGTYAAATTPHTVTVGAEGEYTLICRLIDEAGNEGTPASHTFTFDVSGSTSGPTIEVPGAGPGGETNDTNPEVIVTPPNGETGGYLECKLSGSGYNGEYVNYTTVTSPFNLPELPEGTYTITCRYVDEAGNPGEETSYTIVIDRTAPGAPTVTGPTGPTNDTTPSFTVTPAEAGGTVECKIDDGEFFAVNGSFIAPELSEGTHTVSCRQTDAAGNTGSEGEASVTIDTTAPGSVTIGGPTGATSDTTPSFNLSGAEPGDTYECKVDDGAFAATDSTFVTAVLSEGTHTITCHLVDEAGNVGPDTSVDVEIDSSAPGSVTITGPTGPTNDTTPTITIDTDETDGHIECKIDDGEYVTVTSPWTLPELSEGTHTVTCRNVDGAGNPGAETTIMIVIDTTAPSAITVNGPSGLTNTATPSYTITGGQPDGTYQCKVDGGSFANVGSTYTTSTLSQGAHTVTCQAIDAAGNTTAPVVKNITVDTVAPTLTITNGAPRWDGTHEFNFGLSEAGTIKCGIDGAAATAVTSPYITGVLATGTHSISCTATDAAGNVSAPVVKSFGVFKDPAVTSRTGGFQWGIACTGSALLNWALGCPDDTLTVTIPANPNGLTGNYQVDLTGEIKRLTSVLGLGSKYTMFISVDGTSVASDSETVLFDLFGLFAADLSATKTNLTLSASTAHTIKLSLKTSSFISVLPSAQSSKLSVSIHH